MIRWLLVCHSLVSWQLLWLAVSVGIGEKSSSHSARLPPNPLNWPKHPRSDSCWARSCHRIDYGHWGVPDCPRIHQCVPRTAAESNEFTREGLVCKWSHSVLPKLIPCLIQILFSGFFDVHAYVKKLPLKFTSKNFTSKTCINLRQKTFNFYVKKLVKIPLRQKAAVYTSKQYFTLPLTITITPP